MYDLPTPEFGCVLTKGVRKLKTCAEFVRGVMMQAPIEAYQPLRIVKVIW